MALKNDVKDAITELVDNLGTVGVFMLGETRALLRRSWGASRQEFMAAVDQAARTMKQSGKMAAEDVERAAEKVKQSWELLQKEKDLEWDSFFNELSYAAEDHRQRHSGDFRTLRQSGQGFTGQAMGSNGPSGRGAAKSVPGAVGKDGQSCQRAVERFPGCNGKDGQKD